MFPLFLPVYSHNVHSQNKHFCQPSHFVESPVNISFIWPNKIGVFHLGDSLFSSLSIHLEEGNNKPEVYEQLHCQWQKGIQKKRKAEGWESRQKNVKISILKPVPAHVKLAVHFVNPSSASVENSQQAAGYNIQGCPFLCFFHFWQHIVTYAASVHFHRLWLYIQLT